MDEILYSQWGQESQEAIELIAAAIKDVDIAEVYIYDPANITIVYEQSSKIRYRQVLSNIAFINEKELSAFCQALVTGSNSPTTWEELKEKGAGVIKLNKKTTATIIFPPITPSIGVAFRKRTP